MTRKDREDVQPTAQGRQQQQFGGRGAVLGVCNGAEAGAKHHGDAEDVASRAGLWREPAQAAGRRLGSAGLAETGTAVEPVLPTFTEVCLRALKTLPDFYFFLNALDLQGCS